MSGPAGAAGGDDRPQRAIALWLFLVAAMVAAMVILGGATRLTHSGLSMVDWRPITGVLPPFGEEAWQRAYTAYQQYPEYRKINRDMGLTAFKAIFWFEYSHRLLGRLIGLVFLLPFLWFLVRRRIGRRLGWQLGGVFLLGALQGYVGWWMVASGLIDRPDVSQYRLAVHLALALAILGLLLRIAWRLSVPGMAGSGNRAAWPVLGLVYLQALSGALVAGLDAGLQFNTFPMMDGRWLPPDTWRLSPWWRNPLENATTVQFDHRLGAALATVAVVLLWWHGRRRADVPGSRRALDVMLALLAAQVGLGIATLLLQVPVPLGVLHQAGALALFAAVLFVAQRPLRRAAAGA